MLGCSLQDIKPWTVSKGLVEVEGLGPLASEVAADYSRLQEVPLATPNETGDPSACGDISDVSGLLQAYDSCDLMLSALGAGV